MFPAPDAFTVAITEADEFRTLNDRSLSDEAVIAVVVPPSGR